MIYFIWGNQWFLLGNVLWAGPERIYRIYMFNICNEQFSTASTLPGGKHWFLLFFGKGLQCLQRSTDFSRLEWCNLMAAPCCLSGVLMWRSLILGFGTGGWQRRGSLPYVSDDQLRPPFLCHSCLAPSLVLVLLALSQTSWAELP